MCNLTLLFLLAVSDMAGADDLTTPWEHDPERTPRYAETIDWCRRLARSSDQVAFDSFGTSPRGRDLPLLI